MTQTHHQHLPAVEALCRQAGQAILEIYGKEDFQVQSKNDASPLTAADLASNQVLVQGLEALTPDIPVLSEESSHIPWAQRQSWERYWLVDPLDGTKEFIKRNDEFTVNVALIEGGAPVMGVVYMPVGDITWSGARGHGAHRKQGDQAPTALEVTAANAPLTVAVSRSHPSQALQAFMDGLGQVQTRALGSSLKFCLIAEGQVDLYPRLGPTSEWDTAAAQAVLEAAGGVILREDGSALPYNTKESYLNPWFFALGDRSLWPRVQALLADA
jgi:3'(2'), 5'-bisphosphate nucleotidase